MARQTATFELALPSRAPGEPAWRWLSAALRADILEGRLRPGTRLPGTRELARQCGLSRGTLVGVFEQLRAEGYVEGTVGSGTYVSRVLPDDLLRARKVPRGPALPPPPRRFSVAAARLGRFATLRPRPSRAFRANLPALNHFPTAVWAQLAARRARGLSAQALTGCPSAGDERLREAIADYLVASRGVRCSPGQVLIVSGVQEALDLTARLFLDPGDCVCLEDPGYEGAQRIFEIAGARLVQVPVDSAGMKRPAATRAKLACVTPAHQLPLGMTMAATRRLELLEWAQAAGALIFEDDYDGEYRYAGRPVPALQGLDRAGVVLFAGSFSKVLFPSLRLGYLVVPEDLVQRFADAKSVFVRHPPLFEQSVLCDFIVEGHFGRHLRRMRALYAERLDALLSAARSELSGLLELSEVEAGLQTVGFLREGLEGEAVARAAAERGLEVTPLSRFGRAPEGLLLGFAACDAKELRRGVQELAEVLRAQARPAGRRRPLPAPAAPR